MLDFDVPAALNGDQLAGELIDADLPLADEDDVRVADGRLKVRNLTEDHRSAAQDVIDAHVPPPPPPDVDHLLLAAFAPSDQGGLGRQKARELIKEYPDLQTALDKKNWTIARQALEDAKNEGVLNSTQYDTLIALFDEYNIPNE